MQKLSFFSASLAEGQCNINVMQLTIFSIAIPVSDYAKRTFLLFSPASPSKKVPQFANNTKIKISECLGVSIEKVANIFVFKETFSHVMLLIFFFFCYLDRLF